MEAPKLDVAHILVVLILAALKQGEGGSNNPNPSIRIAGNTNTAAEQDQSNGKVRI